MEKKISYFKQWAFIFKLTFMVVFLMTSSIHAAPPLTVQDLETWLQENYSLSLGDLQVPDLGLSYSDSLTMTCPVEFDLLSKAQPDECYYGLCDTDNSYPANSFPCPDIGGKQGVPKVNQAYVWGMTMAEDGKIWFGTAPNTHCLVLSGYLGMTSGFETDSYACQLGNCPQGDWRPSEIYSYDPGTRLLVKRSSPANMLSTLGIRSAGSSGGVIFLAGPAFPIGSGVTLFAYSTDGTLLDTRNLNTCISNETLNTTNIRKWLTVNGSLYTTIGTATGGRVLKWTGSNADPFHFEVVGVLDAGEGAELAFHEGRIFVTTWPAGGKTLAGLFMSPVVPEDGLPASLTQWDKAWEATDYEPDAITASTYGGGALASFDGYLYWGTMHVPMLSFAAYSGGSLPSQEPLEAFLGSYRAISIFRCSDFDEFDASNDKEDLDIDLVYGMPQLPVSSPDGSGGYNWTLTNNIMDALPIFGPSGFGNMFNNYTWSMQVFGGKLWIGTMDWSYLLGELAEGPLTQFLVDNGITSLPENLTNLPKYFYGADLFCMNSSDTPALPLCLSGLGNYTNYGIRNMLADENKIYFGMANPMNLLTDTTDDLPEGGWELLSRGDLEVDGDLVSADLEDMAPNNGDGNGDNVPDREQPHVASIQANDSQNLMTVEVLDGNCSQIRGIMPISDGFLPPDEGYVHPYGNMYIMLQCDALSGGSATIRIYYHGNASTDGLEYRKFGQTSPNTPPVWFTYPDAVFGRTIIGGRTVVYADLTLTDNELGDFFLHNNPGDGFIIDPGGPARAPQSISIPTLSEWGMMVTMLLLGLTGIIYMRKRRLSAFE